MTPWRISKTTQDSSKTVSEGDFIHLKNNLIFCFVFGTILLHFGSPNASLWAPFWRPKSVKKAIGNWTAQSVAARSPEDRPRPPKTLPRAPQDPPRRPQDPPRSPQGHLRPPQDAPKSTPRPPKSAPRPHKSSQDVPKTPPRPPKRHENRTRGQAPKECRRPPLLDDLHVYCKDPRVGENE